jgi:hypothetical protein
MKFLNPITLSGAIVFLALMQRGIAELPEGYIIASPPKAPYVRSKITNEIVP